MFASLLCAFMFTYTIVNAIGISIWLCEVEHVGNSHYKLNSEKSIFKIHYIGSNYLNVYLNLSVVFSLVCLVSIFILSKGLGLFEIDTISHSYGSIVLGMAALVCSLQLIITGETGESTPSINSTLAITSKRKFKRYMTLVMGVFLGKVVLDFSFTLLIFNILT